MKLLIKLFSWIGMALLLPMSSAQAHAHLVYSNPAAGAVLAALPAEISLAFDDPLISIAGKVTNVIIVKDAIGNEISTGESITDVRFVRVGLAGKAVTGAIYVTWRVVAEDGHPQEGAFTFSISDTSTPATVISAPISAVPEKRKFNGVLLFVLTPIAFALLYLARRKWVR